MALLIDLSFIKNRASWRRMTAVWLVSLALGLTYALLAPRWYISGLTVVPARPTRASGLSSMLGGELAGLAAGLDTGSGSTADPARIAAVLQSNAVSDAVIEKFSLKERYRDKYIEDTREDLWRHCMVKTLPKPSMVQVTCEDKDPTFARDMLGYLVSYGNETFRRVSVSSATEEARFLEKRVAELKEQANAASDRMREFQETHGIVDLDTQARAVVSALSGLQSQSIAKQLELEYARTFSAADEPSTRQLEAQLTLVTEKLRSLEIVAPPQAGQAGKRATGSGVFPKALAVPQLRAEYESHFRDRRVTEASLVVALGRLENAKANEARDVSTFLVMDPPSMPAKHVRPKLSLTMLVSALLGLLCSLTLEWYLNGGASRLRRMVPGRVDAPPATPGA